MTKRILKCLVLDDESHALKILDAYIEKTPFLEVTLSTSSVWDAMESLKKGEPDLLFLDIQMDELSGIQLLDIIGKTCPVILTTAYSEYALKGYEYQVVDYLLKPFSFERFLKAVTRVFESSKEKNSGIKVKQEASEPDTIFIKGDSKNKFHQVKLNEICFVEGLKNYVQFFCIKSKVITLQNLKDLSDQLPQDQFLRIHKSYIVNLKMINQIEGNSVLIGDKRIPIGASYKAAFFNKIKSLNS